MSGKKIMILRYEMSWISVKDKLPETCINCLVSNSKGWMFEIRAIYHPREKVFQLYDPTYRETILLDVTHYLEIPDPPRE